MSYKWYEVQSLMTEWRRVIGGQEIKKSVSSLWQIRHTLFTVHRPLGRQTSWQTFRPTGCTQVGTGTEATGRHKQVYTGCLKNQKMKVKALTSDPKPVFIKNNYTQKRHFARNSYTRDYITANFYSFPDTWCQPLLDDSESQDVRRQP